MTKGFKDSHERKIYEGLCGLSEHNVLSFMANFLKNEKYEVIETKESLIGIGSIPVGICAHADTVFKNAPNEFFYDAEKTVIWSPDGMGADDRAGIYSIIKLVTGGYHPHIIINTGEEKGCLGAADLVGQYKQFPADLKFLIQLDRRGIDDCVFYDCCNDEFEKFINSYGFTTQIGSFTDISVLAPAWGVAAVNLSIGYFNEHSPLEYLNVEAMNETIRKVMLILINATSSDIPVFEYIERPKPTYDLNITADDDISLYSSIVTSDGKHYERCVSCGTISLVNNFNPVYYARDEEPVYICKECCSNNFISTSKCPTCGKHWLRTVGEATATCKFCKK